VWQSESVEKIAHEKAANIMAAATAALMAL